MNNYEMLLGADTANMQAGGRSFFSAATDFVTMGLPSAALSGAQSILNTGIDFSNAVFQTNTEKADTLRTLENFDTNWAAYYKDNQSLVDTTGFVLGSLVPGTLGMKALRLAQEGAVGGAMKTVFGFTSTQKTYYLEEALKDVASSGGNVFQAINKNKSLSMVWGAADQALQAAAYETATAVTMKSSPMLEKEEWGHVLWDITKTSLLGGGIGGGIEALLTNRIVKDAGKLVASKQRGYDILADAGKGGLSTGDRAYSIFDAVDNLPKELLDPKIPFKYARGGELDTSALLNRTLETTVKQSYLKIEQQLIDISPIDVTVGKSLASAVVRVAKQAVEQGVSKEESRQRLGDLLFGLRSADGIGNGTTNLSGDVVWLNTQVQDLQKGLFFTKEGNPGQKAYRIIGDEDNAKLAVLGKDARTTEEAFALNYDAVLDPSTKQLQISPFSTVYKSLTPGEAKVGSLFFNTRTLTTSDTAVAAIADIATAAKPLTLSSINKQGLSAGNRTFLFNAGNFAPPEGADAVWYTARHVWADAQSVFKGDVRSNDFSVLDALLKDKTKASADLQILDVRTNTLQNWADITDKDAFVFSQKRTEILNDLQAGPDQRALAYKMNVDETWLQKAIDTGFKDETLLAERGWTRDASAYMERENLVMRYNTDGLDLATFKAEGTTAYYQRVQEAQVRATDASAAVLGAEWSAKMLDVSADLTKFADQQNVGPSLLAASNANYGDRLRSWAQYTGSLLAKITTERVNAALTTLQSPAAKLLANPKVAGEASAAITMLRRSTEKFGLYQDTREGWMLVDLPSLKKVNRSEAPIFKERFALSDEVGEFFAAHQALHAKRIDQQGVLQVAQGLEKRWDPEAFYVPPIDTRRTPFFAFVRRTEGAVFGGSDTAMITARSSTELQKLADNIPSGFDVIFKKDTEAYFKAKGDYEYGRTMNQPEIDSFLRKNGKLGDFIPNMTPEAVVEDFVQYTQRAETKLARDAVSVRYGSQINELQALSERYSAPQQSAMRGLDRFYKAKDPFADTISLAMNVSKQSSFTLWHQANEFVDAAGKMAYRGVEAAVLEARQNKITWQEAQQQMEKFGIGPVLNDEAAFKVAQTAGDRNLIKMAFNKANMLLVNGVLRLDSANSLMNIISTPILLGTEVASLRKAFKNDPELQAFFSDKLSVAMPGTEVTVPTASKLIFDSVKNYFGKDSKALLDRYVGINVLDANGAVRGFHEMSNELSLVPNLVPSKYAATVDKWVETGAKWSGSNKAEEMTRFVSANVMHQITEPLVLRGAMSVAEQNSWISTFVNRVQGNYVASQRPIIFQGTLGSAVGLFQTYQFNMLQQIFRHIENKDAKTLAVLAGMQGSFYGLHGLPFFDAINTNIIGNASINEKHHDLYSASVQAFGKGLGDWLMYGTASAMPLFGDKAPALWSRGDMNPRSMTILPINPMDVPAVQAAGKVIGAITTFAKQVGSGADVLPSLLFGLEHNGINRPLAGLAQVAKGTATTSGGDLISSSQDMNSITTFSRLIGAKPLDESIALNTVYRSKAYQAADKAKLDELGVTVKDKLRSGKEITSDDWTELMGKYAASGGRIEGFAQAVQRWNTNANVSLVNQMAQHVRTPAGQRMTLLLGGQPLEDFQNAPRTPEQ